MRELFALATGVTLIVAGTNKLGDYLDERFPLPPDQPAKLVSTRAVPYVTPPREIQHTVRLIDAGHDVSSQRLDTLSRWISDHPASWNVWCREER